MAILVVAALIGLIPAFIAKNKGRSFGLWWLFGAAFFIVALPAALLMKPVMVSPSGQRVPLENTSVGLVTCPSCRWQVPSGWRTCPNCSTSTDIQSLPRDLANRVLGEQSPSATSAAAVATAQLSFADVADQLAKLGDLRDRGVLTDQEFADQKSRLLQ